MVNAIPTSAQETATQVLEMECSRTQSCPQKEMQELCIPLRFGVNPTGASSQSIHLLKDLDQSALSKTG